VSVTVGAPEHRPELVGRVVIAQVVDDGERLLPGPSSQRGLVGRLAQAGRRAEGDPLGRGPFLPAAGYRWRKAGLLP
jgi:hypothetical protein